MYLTGVTLDCVNCGGRFVRGYTTACCDNPTERTCEPTAKPTPAVAPRVFEAGLEPRHTMGAMSDPGVSHRVNEHPTLLAAYRQALAKVGSLNASWSRESELRAEFEKQATRLEAERDAFDKDGSEQMWRANRAERERDALAELVGRALVSTTLDAGEELTDDDGHALTAAVRKLRQERDRLRAHIDAAGDGMNLAELLDLYQERKVAAERERDDAQRHATEWKHIRERYELPDPAPNDPSAAEAGELDA